MARVCVLVVLRDEESYLSSALDSVVQQTFPSQRLEIAIVDMLRPGSTRNALQAYAQRHPHVRVMPCTHDSTSVAVNLAVLSTDADVIVRMDGRTCLAPDYIERCVLLLATTGAASAGGHARMDIQSEYIRAMAIAMRSLPPDGRSESYYQRMEYNDAMFPCALRREAFLAVGGYDEALTYRQSDDLNGRLRRAGFQVVQYPAILSSSTPRVSLSTMCRDHYRLGVMHVHAVRGRPPSPRDWVTMSPSLGILFINEIIAVAVLGLIGLLVPVLLYLCLVCVNGTIRVRRKLHLAPLVIGILPCIHLSYEFGVLTGLLRTYQRRDRAPMPGALGDPLPVDIEVPLPVAEEASPAREAPIAARRVAERQSWESHTASASYPERRHGNMQRSCEANSEGMKNVSVVPEPGLPQEDPHRED